ncbi:alpha/beta hydrolase fold-3 domain protein [Mycobacterium intracellulare]|nr:alpha/beta hydrolase fold-3 domain protein [Mycobacterium intracellulare]
MRFPEVSGRTSEITVPTRHGPPARPSITRRPAPPTRPSMSTCTAAGSWSGTPNRTTRGAATWPPARAWW